MRAVPIRQMLRAYGRAEAVHGRAPTIREVSEFSGVSFSQTANWIAKLKAKGHVPDTLSQWRTEDFMYAPPRRPANIPGVGIVNPYSEAECRLPKSRRCKSCGAASPKRPCWICRNTNLGKQTLDATVGYGEDHGGPHSAEGSGLVPDLHPSEARDEES